MFYSDCGFESQIAHESLRGNKELIALIKSDIKTFSATQRTEKTLWNIFISTRHKSFNAGIACPIAMPDYKTISRPFMRHLFLAYAYLRFKSLDRTEPNTKEPKLDSFYYNRAWYSGSPSSKLVNVIIEEYDLKLQKEKAKLVSASS